MNDEILFKEVQRFKQWWLWLILIGTNGLIGYGVVKQIVFGMTFGDHPGSDSGLLIALGVSLCVTLLMIGLRLETVIKRDGIYVKFFPFYLSFKHYPWEQIQNVYVREYKPIMEYGGWGLRGFGKNRALNVSGNQGLQLELVEGKRLLIGTKKSEEIAELLRKTGKQ